MKKIATTLLISSLALGGFTVAHADYDRYENSGKSGKYCNKKGKKSGYRKGNMFERLDLTDEQLKKVRGIRDDYRPKMQELGDKARDKRKELREVMHSDTIDQAKVKKLAKEVGDLKEDKIILRAEMRAKIHKVLTKEQRQKFKEMKDQRGYGNRYDRRS